MSPTAKKTATKTATKTAKKTASKSSTRASEAFSAEEKAAMKERAREVKAQKAGADGEAEVLARIASMPQPDRGLAEGFHALVKDVAPDLACRTWYGMPAYTKGGKVVCFFKDAAKFKSRYATVGFEETAALDDGPLWVTSYALLELTPAVTKKLREVVKQAAG